MEREQPAGQPEVEPRNNDPPQLWIGSLSDYTAGRLHGSWINAARPPAEIWEDIRSMLAASPEARLSGQPAEEWGIFDSDGFGPLRVGEYDDIDWLSAVAKGIVEHGAAFAAWVDHVGREVDLDSFSDTYLGHYDSETAYAEAMAEDFGWEAAIETLPEPLRWYVRFDAEGFGRDLRIGGDIEVVDDLGGGVWIFSG